MVFTVMMRPFLYSLLFSMARCTRKSLVVYIAGFCPMEVIEPSVNNTLSVALPILMIVWYSIMPYTP